MVQADEDKALFFGAVYGQDKEEILARLGPGGDNERAIEAAVRGRRALCAHWQQDGEKARAAEAMSAAAFEAWSDAQVLKTAETLAQDPFGPGALAAYWLKTKAETQTIGLRLLEDGRTPLQERGRLQYA